MSDVFEYPPMVNRFALAVTHKQAFLDWVRTTPGSESISLDDVNREASFYLVPEAEGEATDALAACYEDIFELELQAWCTDTSHWPEALTLDLFHRFFEVRAGSRWSRRCASTGASSRPAASTARTPRCAASASWCATVSSAR